jgi:hypothetical protein
VSAWQRLTVLKSSDGKNNCKGDIHDYYVRGCDMGSDCSEDSRKTGGFLRAEILFFDILLLGGCALAGVPAMRN